MAMPAQDLTLYAKWTAHSFNLYFDANGGTVEETSRLVLCDQPFGSLPTPVRDYYTFTGWYTVAGEKITENSTVATATNITVYAHWEQNPVSDWVLASNLPADAQVIEQKWTYTLTENTESRETSLSGWTQTGGYWIQSGSGSGNYAWFPGGFNTSHSIYTSFTKSAATYTAYETETTKREVSNQWAGYVYWHWMYNVHYSTTTGRTIADRYCSFDGLGFYYFYAIKSSVDCPYLSNSYVANYAPGSAPATYNCASILPASSSSTDGMGTPRMLRFSYYTSSYTDYYKMFQYEKITTGLESESMVTEGSGISDVLHYVRYRAK